MERWSIVLGLLLCGLSVGGLFVSHAKMPMLFVPMLLGIPMLLFGVVSLNPHRRRVGMRLTAAVGGIGVVFGILQLVRSGWRMVADQPVNRLGFVIVLAMTALCVIVVGGWLATPHRRPRRNRGRNPFDPSDAP